MSFKWNWAQPHDAIMTLHTMNATMFDIFSDGVGGFLLIIADCGKRASRDLGSGNARRALGQP